MRRRARRSRSCWPAIWAEVLGVRAGRARRTTSSSWAATRCWRRRWSSRVRERLRGRAAAARAVRGADGGGARRAASRRRAGGATARRRRSLPVPRDGDAAAVVRPAAALVPRPARAGQPGLQHPGWRCALRGRAGRRGCWRAASARSCAATRRCARRSPRRTAQPVQVIAPAAAAFALPVVDLAGLPAARARGRGRAAWPREEARRPFDLARGPLLRAALLRLGAERARRCC